MYEFVCLSIHTRSYSVDVYAFPFTFILPFVITVIMCSIDEF